MSLFHSHFHGTEIVMKIVLCFISPPFHCPEDISWPFKSTEAIKRSHHEFPTCKIYGPEY